MPVRVLYLEDAGHTGSLLRAYLNDHLARLANGPASVGRDGSPANAFSGVMSPLRPRHWGEYAPTDFQVEVPAQNEVEALTKLTEITDLEPAVAKMCKRYLGKRAPDVLIVDLALSDAEQKRLKKARGDFAPTLDDLKMSLREPRKTRRTVARLTGYRVLVQAAAKGIPVIATSGASNPLIAQECMVGGAFAVVHKPIPEGPPRQESALAEDTAGPERALAEADEEVFRCDMAHARRMGPVEIDRQALHGEDTFSVVVHQYLTSVAREVLKATVYLALQADRGTRRKATPRPVQLGPGPRRRRSTR